VRRFGAMSGQFFSVLPLPSLRLPTVGPIEFAIPGISGQYAVDEAQLARQAELMWAIKTAPAGQSMVTTLYGETDALEQGVIARAYPEPTQAGLRGALDEQIALHEMLHGWFKDKRLFRPTLKPYIAFLKWSKSAGFARNATDEHAAYLGGLAISNRATWMLQDLIYNKLPMSAKQSLSSHQLAANRLFAEIISTLPPSLTSGSKYTFGENEIVHRDRAIAIFRKLDFSRPAVLEQAIKKAARDTFHGYGALPDEVASQPNDPKPRRGALLVFPLVREWIEQMNGRPIDRTFRRLHTGA
jgi:hypothetical protein